MSAEVNAPECACPICTIGQALRMLDRAHERWIEHGTNEEMNLSYLIDEVQVYLDTPWWRRRTTRLSEVLGLVKNSARKNGRVWRHGD